MDFFNDQENIKTKSYCFFICFFIAVALAVVAMYFMISWALVAMNQGGSSRMSQVSIEATNLWSWGVAKLPQSIYGSPPAILSLKPFLIIGSFLASFILIVSLYETRRIKQNGGQFMALAIGGRLIETTDNFQEKQFRNVVHEMALAAGLPIPHLYVLERETSINAITAGLDEEDIFIAVTAGALKHLNREELQGVIAHEFAHIFNGDYHFNLIMAGWLYGLLCVYARGKDLIEMAAALHRTEAIIWATIIALPFIIGGSFGRLAAAAVQAAFSRKRELLADSFALRFTRNPAGLAGALKKIAAYPRHGALISGKSLMMNSFFIANPSRINGIFRTHPPIEKRIEALEPHWDGTLPELSIDLLNTGHQKNKLSQVADLGLAGTMGGQRLMKETASTLPLGPAGALVLQMLAMADLTSTLPKPNQNPAPNNPPKELPEQTIKKALANPTRAVLAVFITDDPELTPKSSKIISDLWSADEARRTNSLKALVPPDLRLVVLNMVAPLLADLSAQEQNNLTKGIKFLIAVDGRFRFFEIAGCQILRKNLDLRPPNFTNQNNSTISIKQFQEATLTVLSLLAQVGTENDEEATKALVAGFSSFNQWPPPQNQDQPLIPRDQISSAVLLKALDTLEQAPHKIKKLMLQAAATCALYGEKINSQEYEILAALAATLEHHPQRG